MDFSGLIVGLGNPGDTYALTRHNFGFMLADALLDACRMVAPHDVIQQHSRKIQGDLYRVRLPGAPGLWLVLKPMTFMNESGRSVSHVAGFYKLPPERMLIVHDELDLPLGRMKLKMGGGTAGHNGLRSIAGLLGSKEFYRLRLGVGKPEHKDTRNFVLNRFSSEECKVRDDILKAAVRGVFLFASQGFVPAQQEINGYSSSE